VPWAKETGKVAANAVTPDFDGMILREPLKQIAPERVEL
jgi:hypothetical protein